MLLLALAALAVAGAACTTLVKNDRHELFSKARHGTDRFVKVDGRNLHYVEAGEGPPILLIPGAFSTYRVWNRMIPELSLRYRVLAIDYLGMGDSDKPESGFGYSIEEQAKLVAEMIEILDLRGVYLVGASYGSAIALTVASRHPGLVRKVACIEGGPLIVPETLKYSRMYFVFNWPILGDVTMGMMKTGLFDETVARVVMGNAWDRMADEDKREILEVMSYNIKTASRASWYGIYRAIRGVTDLTGPMKDTRVPIFYLYGKESKYREVAEANADFLRKNVPTSEIVALPGGIHDLQLQQPLNIAAVVGGFFERAPVTESPAHAKTADASAAPDGDPDAVQ